MKQQRYFERRNVPPPDSFDASRVDGYRDAWVETDQFGIAFRFATDEEVAEWQRSKEATS